MGNLKKINIYVGAVGQAYVDKETAKNNLDSAKQNINDWDNIIVLAQSVLNNTNPISNRLTEAKSKANAVKTLLETEMNNATNNTEKYNALKKLRDELLALDNDNDFSNGGNTYTLDNGTIIQKLQFCSPNNVPSLLSQSLIYYNKKYSNLFRICYLFECQVPLELCDYIDASEQNLDLLIDAGIFICDSGLLTAQNEFVKDWIMHAYSYNSLSIQNTARRLLNDSKKITYNIGYVNIYRVLGYNKQALLLLEKNINILKKERQYSMLRKGLLQAVDIANSLHDRIQEIKYLIELLEIITIQKEITTDEAKTHIDRLDDYSQSGILPSEGEYALSFFKIKIKEITWFTVSYT